MGWRVCWEMGWWVHWQRGWEVAGQLLETPSPWGPLAMSGGVGKAHCPTQGRRWMPRVDVGPRLCQHRRLSPAARGRSTLPGCQQLHQSHRLGTRGTHQTGVGHRAASQQPPASPVPPAEPGGCTGPAASPVPGEQQGFTLAPAFPLAVAGMRWPREQCRHLAPGPLGAGSSCPGTAQLPRSRQEADGDDTGGRFLRQDALAFSTAAPAAEPGPQGRGAHGRPKPRATRWHRHPAAPTLCPAATGPALHVARGPGAGKLLPRGETSRNWGNGTSAAVPQLCPAAGGGRA